MCLSASIIEQRVRKLVEDHRGALGSGDDDKLRSKAFVLLTTSVVLDIPLSEALSLVTDGGHDLAIDALHVGDIIEGEFLVTVVQGKNDICPEGYARMIQDSWADFVEVKGYMYLGYSRKRLSRENMPEHEHVREFAEAITGHCDYRLLDERPISRVVCLERIQ